MDSKTQVFLLALRDLLPNLRQYSDTQLEKKIGKDKLGEVVNIVFGYIESGTGSLQRNQQYAMVAKVLNCLGQYINVVGFPVTLTTVTERIHLIYHAVEQQFPGYHKAKMLKFLIQSGGVGDTGQ